MDKRLLLHLAENFLNIDQESINRAKGDLEQSGKFRDENVTPEEASRFVLGAMAGNAEATDAIFSLKSEQGNELGDELVKVFEEPKIAKWIAGIHVCRNFPEARIYRYEYPYNDDINFEITEEVFKADKKDRPAFIVEAKITGGAIRVLVRTLHRIGKHGE